MVGITVLLFDHVRSRLPWGAMRFAIARRRTLLSINTSRLLENILGKLISSSLSKTVRVTNEYLFSHDCTVLLVAKRLGDQRRRRSRRPAASACWVATRSLGGSRGEQQKPQKRLGACHKGVQLILREWDCKFVAALKQPYEGDACPDVRTNEIGEATMIDFTAHE
jgi:hypothetical protein